MSTCSADRCKYILADNALVVELYKFIHGKVCEISSRQVGEWVHMWKSFVVVERVSGCVRALVEAYAVEP